MVALLMEDAWLTMPPPPRLPGPRGNRGIPARCSRASRHAAAARADARQRAAGIRLLSHLARGRRRSRARAVRADPRGRPDRNADMVRRRGRLRSVRPTADARLAAGRREPIQAFVPRVLLDNVDLAWRDDGQIREP